MPDEVAGLTKLPTAPPPGAPVGGDDEAVGEDWFAGGDSGGNGGGEAGNGEPAAKRPNVQYGATGLKQVSPAQSEDSVNNHGWGQTQVPYYLGRRSEVKGRCSNFAGGGVS